MSTSPWIQAAPDRMNPDKDQCKKENHEMTSHKFTGKLGELIEKAEHGSDLDVDYIMSHLTDDSSLAMTRYVDYALSLVENPNGIKLLEYFLFNGTE